MQKICQLELTIASFEPLKQYFDIRKSHVIERFFLQYAYMSSITNKSRI